MYLGNLLWTQGGLRDIVDVLQVIGMGTVVGFPPLVASPVIGHLTDIELIGTNSSKVSKDAKIRNRYNQVPHLT